LFYFYALKDADATKVASIDRSSIVCVVVFAGLFLAECISAKTVIGEILMAVGAIMISIK